MRGNITDLQTSSRETTRLVEQQSTDLGNRFEHLTNRVSKLRTNAKTAIVSFRVLGAQSLDVIRGLSQQTKNILEQIVRQNPEIHTMIREMHSKMMHTPVYDPADTFSFDDALGRTRNLPYEFFRHTHIFKSFLRVEFRGSTGELKVRYDRVLVCDAVTEKVMDHNQNRGSVVFSGSRLVMSVSVGRSESRKDKFWNHRYDDGSWSMTAVPGVLIARTNGARINGVGEAFCQMVY